MASLTRSSGLPSQPRAFHLSDVLGAGFGKLVMQSGSPRWPPTQMMLHAPRRSSRSTNQLRVPSLPPLR